MRTRGPRHGFTTFSKAFYTDPEFFRPLLITKSVQRLPEAAMEIGLRLPLLAQNKALHRLDFEHRGIIPDILSDRRAVKEESWLFIRPVPMGICHRIGRPPISTIGLGRIVVSSLRRVPRPPARITAFIGLAC